MGKSTVEPLQPPGEWHLADLFAQCIYRSLWGHLLLMAHRELVGWPALTKCIDFSREAADIETTPE
jgi:hypothetical protein